LRRFHSTRIKSLRCTITRRLWCRRETHVRPRTSQCTSCHIHLIVILQSNHSQACAQCMCSDFATWTMDYAGVRRINIGLLSKSVALRSRRLDTTTQIVCVYISYYRSQTFTHLPKALCFVCLKDASKEEGGAASPCARLRTGDEI